MYKGQLSLREYVPCCVHQGGCRRSIVRVLILNDKINQSITINPAGFVDHKTVHFGKVQIEQIAIVMKFGVSISALGQALLYKTSLGVVTGERV